MVNAIYRVVQTALLKTRRALPGFPQWITADHVIAFLYHDLSGDPFMLSPHELAERISSSLASTLRAGKIAADEAVRLAVTETSSPPARVIPFNREARHAIRKDERDLTEVRRVIAALREGRKVGHWKLSSALADERALLATIRNKKKLL